MKTLEKRIERKPSLSTMTFEEFSEASEVERKSSIPGVRYHTKSCLKKAVAIALISLGSIYCGARFNKEISQIEKAYWHKYQLRNLTSIVRKSSTT